MPPFLVRDAWLGRSQFTVRLQHDSNTFAVSRPLLGHPPNPRPFMACTAAHHSSDALLWLSLVAQRSGNSHRVECVRPANAALPGRPLRHRQLATAVPSGPKPYFGEMIAPDLSNTKHQGKIDPCLAAV
jgi:hypothetical protein